STSRPTKTFPSTNPTPPRIFCQPRTNLLLSYKSQFPVEGARRMRAPSFWFGCNPASHELVVRRASHSRIGRLIPQDLRSIEQKRVSAFCADCATCLHYDLQRTLRQRHGRVAD